MTSSILNLVWQKCIIIVCCAMMGQMEVNGALRLSSLRLSTSPVCWNMESHPANCGLNLKVPDYWISVQTLCNGIHDESDLHGSVPVCVSFLAHICDLLACFFLWTKMITERRICSINWMSDMEWPHTFSRPENSILWLTKPQCLDKS